MELELEGLVEPAEARLVRDELVEVVVDHLVGEGDSWKRTEDAVVTSVVGQCTPTLRV